MIEMQTLLDGRYRIERRLAEGRETVSYAAHDTEEDREVVIHALKPELAADRAAVGRFESTSTRLNQINHPAIVPMDPRGLQHADPYYVQPRLAARSLQERLDGGEMMAWDDIAAFGERAARALGAAHEGGLVHGGLRPDNLWLTDDGRVLITGFGETTDGRSPTTDEARYAAPETLRGEPATTRSDVFSLAAILHRLLSGGAPYDGPDAETILQLRRTGNPRPMRELRPDIPTNLAVAIDSGLATEPSRRPADGNAFADALTYQEPAPAPITRERDETAWWAWGLGALAGLILLFGLAWLLMTRSVPALLGLSESEARAELLERGLDPDVAGFVVTSTASPGEVVAQEPEPGTRLMRGENVAYTIAWGAPTTDVPSLLGLTHLDAQRRLWAAGLRLGTTTTGTDSVLPAGAVMAQDPAPGQIVEPNTVVDVVINQTVPPIAGSPDVTIEAPAPRIETQVVPVPVPQPSSPEVIRVPEPIPVPTGPTDEEIGERVDRAVERAVRDREASPTPPAPSPAPPRTTAPNTNAPTPPTADFPTPPTANPGTPPRANLPTPPTANPGTPPRANFPTPPTANPSTPPVANPSTPPVANPPVVPGSE